MDAYIGTILPWPGAWAPRGWAFCDGRLLPINTYAALFAILGVQYGGDGRNNFGVPDLRGRTILGANGQAPLTHQAPGQTGGAESQVVSGTGTTSFTLTEANLPAHTHPATLSLSGLAASTKISVSTGTGGQLLATEGCTLSSTGSGGTGAAIYQLSTVSQTSPVTLGGVTTAVTGTGSVSVGSTGSGAAVPLTVSISAPVKTMPPFLALNYIICLDGIFPPRN